MNLEELEGRKYGPALWLIEPAAVSDFVEVTGDDHERWSECAPPGFAAAALFRVAPDLLAELYDRSVVHGEQTFAWKAELRIGAALSVEGVVARVRERGGVNFITFEVTVGDADAPVLEGGSLFLVSGESLPGEPDMAERPEPPHSYRGDPGDGEVAASRADLIRYAAATRDWNPVHWDHDAGIAAGFPGVVVHGLLQAAWALRFASTGVPSTWPFSSARFRFRNPLLPARPVSVRVEGTELVLADDDREYLSATVEPADG